MCTHSIGGGCWCAAWAAMSVAMPARLVHLERHYGASGLHPVITVLWWKGTQPSPCTFSQILRGIGYELQQHPERGRMLEFRKPLGRHLLGYGLLHLAPGRRLPYIARTLLD